MIKLLLSVDYWDIAYEDVITIENAQGKIVANPSDPDIKRLHGGSCRCYNSVTLMQKM